LLQFYRCCRSSDGLIIWLWLRASSYQKDYRNHPGPFGFHLHRWPNVCDEGQNPVRGVLYLQRLVGIRMFSLLFSKTIPNRRLEPPPFSDLPTATCATNAVPDTLSDRHAARSRAAVAASNRHISILFQRLGWPDSSADSVFCLPLRARCTAQPLVGILIFFP